MRTRDRDPGPGTRGRSTAEKRARIGVAIEGADESQYWLEILDDLKLGETDEAAAERGGRTGRYSRLMPKRHVVNDAYHHSLFTIHDFLTISVPLTGIPQTVPE
jgi:hypothetical protein